MIPKKFTTIIILLTLSFSMAFLGVAEAEPIKLENEYIRIVVNTSQANAGRFSVGTTGGDPQRQTDRDKHLIYGGDNPWTSYTTVRIGNQNWVFGGETDRRAGRAGLYGQLIQEPVIKDQTIQSAWQLGPLEIWQILSFARSTTTGLMDTASVKYVLTNTDQSSHMVGARIMLDTMLGANDGAPFLAKGQEIDTDSYFYAPEIPEFWQAFDSLANPQVISQGTLTGLEASAPDRVYFTNWGSAADELWNIEDFVPGRDFKRKGEFELDSAIALFWDQKPLAPGESRSYVTYYGLGGVTIAIGDLILGVSAAHQITADAEGFKTFPVLAYIENDGSGEALDVQAEIKLPPGLKSVDSKVKPLGNLAVGKMIQTGWQLLADSTVADQLTFEVVASATNSEPSRVKLTVDIVSPARLDATLSAPLALGIKDEKYDPPFFKAEATIKNVGGSTAYGGTFEITHRGLELLKGQSARKYTGPIEPGEEVSFNWLLKPTGVSGPSIPYSLKATSNAGEVRKNNFMIIPELKPKIWITDPLPEEVHVGDSFSLSVWATNIREFVGAKLNLNFDPGLLEIVNEVSDLRMGTLFVDESSRPPQILPWQRPQVDNALGEVKGAWGDRGVENFLGLSFGTLLRITFRAKQPGTAQFSLNDVQIWNEYGEISDFEIINKEIIIQP